MIGIDNETLQNIQQTAVEAKGANGKVQILDLPDERPGRYALVSPDGTFNLVDAEPGFRNHTLDSVEMVTGFVHYITETLKAKPVVWYGTEGLVIVIDEGKDSPRRETATLSLESTHQFHLLKNLSEKTYDQKQFIRLLRVDLAGCFGESGPQIISTVRKIEYRSGISGTANIDRGRESLGNELEAEIRSAAGEIPEECDVSVRVFNDPVLRARRSIRCAIEIDARTAEFQLLPLPEQIEDAIDEELENIALMLASNLECPVFRGTP